MAHFGLEHHESSDDRVAEKTFADDTLWRNEASLLPHEMTHSWNGKFRRPAGLATGDYEKPMDGALLWVYEGLTNYLGEVLAARSGIWTAEQYRENLANEAAALDNTPGRDWRPLADTATAAQLLYDGRADGSSYRRSTDFYEEGSLIWLEADTLIRRESKGQRSLDTFIQSFDGGRGGQAGVEAVHGGGVVCGVECGAGLRLAWIFRAAGESDSGAGSAGRDCGGRVAAGL